MIIKRVYNQKSTKDLTVYECDMCRKRKFK